MATQGENQRLLIFSCGGHRFGLPIEEVDRVIQSVCVTKVPLDHPWVLGVINVRGAFLPVVSLRRRFELEEKEIALEDRMILTTALGKPMALLVDDVEGIKSLEGSDFLDEGESCFASVGEKVTLIQSIQGLLGGLDVDAVSHKAGQGEDE